jgi:hypothetical protein
MHENIIIKPIILHKKKMWAGHGGAYYNPSYSRGGHKRIIVLSPARAKVSKTLSQKTKSGMVVHTYKSRIQEAEVARSQAQTSPHRVS